MFTINLLPPQEKARIHLEEAMRLIRFFASSIIFILVIGATLLSPTFFPLVLEQREMDRRLLQVEAVRREEKADEILAHAQAVQGTLRTVKKKLSRGWGATALLVEFTRDLPPAIEITTLTLKENGDLAMGGIAKTRADLLAFEKNLRESGKYESISSPLSNIIPERDVRFAIRAKRKLEFGL